jgi:hypothetical protein
VSRHAALSVLLAVLLPIAVQAAAPAADVPQAATPADRPDEVLDEALVVGTKLWKLRQKAVEVEDRFYALYNQLNKDQDFDVHCHIEAPTGRIIKERVCRVSYIERAQAVEVTALLDGHSAPPSDMVAQARQADFEKHFLQVVNADARLRKLVREREALEKKYDEERKRRVANHSWFRFER